MEASYIIRLLMYDSSRNQPNIPTGSESEYQCDRDLELIDGVCKTLVSLCHFFLLSCCYCSAVIPRFRELIIAMLIVILFCMTVSLLC